MSLVGLMGSVAGFVRVRFLHERADIDNAIFRLHYRFTSAFFFGACCLITAFDLLGSPIDCITDDAFSRPEVINTYCWIQHTFTLPGRYVASPGDKTTGPGDLPQAYPGVGPDYEGRQDKRVHSYYQWVPFVLFFQGVLFYAPHWIWKQFEQGKVRNMTEGSRDAGLGMSLDERKARCSALSQYIQDTLNTNGGFAFAYVLCEVLNLVNVVGNIFFIDRFLNGAFLNYGTRVIKYSNMDQEDRADVLIEVFPRMTKCTFHKYGSSGTIQRHDALCVLAWNIFNEKIYIFLWFWLIILSVLSAAAIVYRFFVVSSTRVRLMEIERIASPAGSCAEAVIRRLPFGDYLLLYMLGQNLEGFLFNGLIEDLAQGFTAGNSESDNKTIAPSATLEMAPILDKFASVDR